MDSINPNDVRELKHLIKSYKKINNTEVRKKEELLNQIAGFEGPLAVTFLMERVYDKKTYEIRDIAGELLAGYDALALGVMVEALDDKDMQVAKAAMPTATTRPGKPWPELCWISSRMQRGRRKGKPGWNAMARPSSGNRRSWSDRKKGETDLFLSSMENSPFRAI